MHRAYKCLSFLFLTAALTAPLATRAAAAQEVIIRRDAAIIPATTIAIIVTTISGMTAKTIPTASTLAKGTETIVNSAGKAIADNVPIGIGAIAIQIAIKTIVT